MIEKLIEHFENKEFFSEKTDDELRSLHFFLLLNTSLGIREELEGNVDIGHAVGAVPPISPYVYLIVCAEFSLTKYLKEVVEFGPLKIVIHTLNGVSANLGYLQPHHYFNVLAAALTALYARFQRIDDVSIPQTLYNIFQIFILYYKEDEAATDYDSRCTAGYKWLSLLRLARRTSRIRFSIKWKIEPPEIYDIKIYEPKDVAMNKDQAIMGFYDRILHKCRAFADILDMNLYISWHEVDINDKTLQYIIGVEAYKLRTVLKKFEKIHSLPAEASELTEILRSVQKEPDKETPTKEEKLDRDELRDRISKEVEVDSKFIAEAEMLIKEDATMLDFETTKTFIYKLCSSRTHGVKEESLKNLVWLLLRGMEFNEITFFIGEFVECYGLNSILYQSDVDLSSHIGDLNALNADDEEKTIKVLVLNKSY